MSKQPHTTAPEIAGAAIDAVEETALLKDPSTTSTTTAASTSEASTSAAIASATSPTTTASATKPAKKRRHRTFEQTPNRMIFGALLVLLGGSLWGINGSVAKTIMTDYAVSPLWYACVRQTIAGVIFLVVSAFTARRQLVGAVKDVRAYPKYILTAFVCVALEQVAYLYVIQYTNGGTATVLQTVNLIMVLAYVCFAARRWPHWRETLGIVMAFCGVVLLATGGNITTLAMPLPALIWGLISAFSAACLAIVPLKFIARWGDMVVNGITFFLAGLMLVPFVQPWRNIPQFDLRGWLLFSFTVVVGTFMAFWFFMAGMSIVGSLRGALLSTVEPIVATITSVAWNGAVFSGADLCGIGLIILMVFVIQHKPAIAKETA